MGKRFIGGGRGPRLSRGGGVPAPPLRDSVGREQDEFDVVPIVYMYIVCDLVCLQHYRIIESRAKPQICTALLSCCVIYRTTVSCEKAYI